MYIILTDIKTLCDNILGLTQKTLQLGLKAEKQMANNHNACFL